MTFHVSLKTSIKFWCMVVALLVTFVLLGVFSSSIRTYAATYYVSTSGSDTNNGTSTSTPWKTLTKVSSITFAAGDSILLKSGDTWSGQFLDLKGNGSSTNWITLSSYGTGNKPKIYPYSSQATVPAADPSNLANNGILWGVRLLNTAGWKINGLEVAYVKSGIVYMNDSPGTRDGLWIENCYIHDIVKWPLTPYPYAENRLPALQIMPYSVGIYTYLGSTGSRLQNVTIKNNTIQYTDGPLEIRHADNVAIDRVTATDSYREGIQLTGINYNYVGTPIGSMTNSTILRSGLSGMTWGTAGLQFNAVHKFTADNIDIGYTKSPNSPDGVGIDYEGLNNNVTVKNSYIHDNDDEAVMYFRNPGWSGGVDNVNTSLINNTFSNNGIKSDGLHAAFLVHGFNENNGGTISGNTIIKASATQALNDIDERVPAYGQFMPKSYTISNNTVMLQNGNIVHYASTEFDSTQGTNGWYYLVNGVQTNMAWENAIPTSWEKGDWHVPGSVAYIGDNWLHPDAGKEVSRQWVAPSNKRIEIIGSAYKLDTGGGDGVDIRIIKNSDPTPLWSGTIAYNNSTGLNHDIQVDVATGDTISFVVNAKANSNNDKVAWDPEIRDLNMQTILTTQTPGTYFQDTQQVELGTKFKTSVSGTISKVRIYTNATESGNHTVRIWRVFDSFVLAGPYTWNLASGTTGWKEFTLPTPLSIAANTDYIVDVSSSTDKFFAVSDNGFNSPINNNNLITYTGSGVFNTILGSMPTSTYNNNNYFRDIVFTPLQTILTTQTPGTFMSDTQAELGTKFKTSMDGIITKVRIYTNAVENGDHAVRIWRVSDSSIVSGPYTWNITSGTVGWREFTLPTPLSINANTEYIVDVSNSTDKYYAWSDYGFNSPINNGNLITYAGSGVFSTTLGSIPTSTYHNSNYFRDIVFVQNGDTMPPALIADLKVSSVTANSAVLNWTATGGDGSYGTASTYDIRYSTSPITDASWANATQVSGEPVPLAAGISQSFTVPGLNASTTYFFAMKASDNIPNTSELSKVTSGMTLAGAQSFNFTQLMTPFWSGTTMYNESLLMVSTSSELPEAKLLFVPTNPSSMTVKDALLGTTYVQGTDWTYDSSTNTIKLTSGSAAAYMNSTEFYPVSAPTGCFLVGKVGGGSVLGCEGHYFHDRQLVVTYTHHSNVWLGPIPTYQGTNLPITTNKLINGQPLKISLFGDSISVGLNASSTVGVSPYMPSWGLLAVQKLQASYSSVITFRNPSVSGQNSAWGAANVASLVSQETPDLVIIAFGMNDGTGNVTPATFKSNIQSMMSNVRTLNPNAEFILVAPTLANSESEYAGLQANYKAVLQQLTTENTGTVLEDMTGVHQELLNTKLFRDMTGNNINHPNDFLIRWYAQALSAILVP
ncbi:hypothetical protein Back11_34450 [Paenibacillus baekrokdamisoli]|uniref:Uncharacterized protein n=1 Tax=Paenibacillus baekrokdamisoli TaxID=1712516 RepID=A0A3G9IT98_9BACL|nr:DUF4082 domain-containing protein [Paenibacillus baekrokdamisoli]MBB3070961.1 lysophospholipase L1-like esterase [Paenibacillus baekrokdamisoli]BBH22100.1 hypothetical protein Back11_34450 [Paenibacillus baekrokdamisoli]